MDLFPPEFDAEHYRALHRDLTRFNHARLEQHYRDHGKHEGRQSSPAQSRDALRELAQQKGSCLEIGPLCNPFLKGDNVYYFDVLDRDKLLEKAKAHGLCTDTMPETIHYWHEKGDLSVIDKKFDLIFSSHCIEHQPDLIAHLKQVEGLLAEGGVYVAIIPDKRFCFDHFLPETVVDNVIDVYAHQRDCSLMRALDHLWMTTHNDAGRHWGGDHGEKRVNQLTSLEIAKIVEDFTAYHQRGDYLDSHHWQFWPDQFRYIIQKLNVLDYVQLNPVRVYQTLFRQFEFVAVLSRGKVLAEEIVQPNESLAWEKIMKVSASRRDK